MALNYKAKGSDDFKRCPPGSHLAVCNLVADIGVQESLFGSKRQLYIRFEVPAERVEYERDGKKVDGPQVIGITCTASMHKKANLRKLLEGWRGKAFTDDEAESFDVSSILGKPCMLNVIETEGRDGKIYSNIASIGKLPKGVQATKAENPLLFYCDSDTSSYDQLPEWLRKKIDEQIVTKKPEPTTQEDDSYYDQVYAGTEITDEDIPF